MTAEELAEFERLLARLDQAFAYAAAQKANAATCRAAADEIRLSIETDRSLRLIRRVRALT
jgi:hypothetical protein